MDYDMDYDTSTPITERLAQQNRVLEQAEKMQAQGMVGRNETSEPAQESMRERFQYRLSRATREARSKERLEELLYLLDKNPEVARILELIESLQ